MTPTETPAALIVQGLDVETRALKMLATFTGARSIAGLGNGAFRLVDARPHEHIAGFCANEKLDWAWVPATRGLDTLRLAAFDMDSTLITIECIDELADFAGCKDKVSEITAAAITALGPTATDVAKAAAKMDAFRNAASYMSVVFLVGLIALIFLPETKGRPMPEDVEPAK